MDPRSSDSCGLSQMVLMDKQILVIPRCKDPAQLTKLDLAYMPKILLLKHWGHHLEELWHKLPEHIKIDIDMLFERIYRKDAMELTREDLQYIPKSMMLKRWGDDVEIFWHYLPDHIRRDPEIHTYLLCWTHHSVDGLKGYMRGPQPPQERNCRKCIAEKETQQSLQ